MRRDRGSPCPGILTPLVRTVACHGRSQISPQDTRRAPRLVHRLTMIESQMRNDALLGTVLAQVSGEGSRIQPLDRHDTGLAQILMEGLLAAPVAGDPARL